MGLKRPARVLAATVAVAALAIDEPRGQTAEVAALAPAVASYDIAVSLDAANRALTGAETITWRNPARVAATSLRFHLYWNAWRHSRTSWLRQASLGAGGDVGFRSRDEYGWQEVTTIRLKQADGSDGPDLRPSFRYIYPDDQNYDDQSLAAVDLPHAVQPGETIQVAVTWTARVPRPFARTGAIGDYFFIAQWFPKLGVFEDAGWNAHQFFANTEFYADFGRYDVRITVPTGWPVGATGVEQERRPEGATTTHRYVQDAVHDFAWTTSPHFVERKQTFRHETLPPVEMRLLLQPEHEGQADRHFAATAAALKYYGEWYGAYPYPQITVIDPAWQSASEGMEYPTLFTAGTRWLAPRQSNEPEAVTVHEAGHQFWYGMVANNEVDHAWMDEGLNTFSDARVQEAAFAPDYRVDRFFGGFIPWQHRDIVLTRETDHNGLNEYRKGATRDAQATPTWQYWPGTHYQITYFKTALWLHTLERHLGWETLRRGMQDYFDRYRFAHPTPEEFFGTLNDAAGPGQDLTWFFDQVYGGSQVFDYGIESLTSEPLVARGYISPTPLGGVQRGSMRRNGPLYTARGSTGIWRTTVVVRRFGDGVFPVDLEVTFEDGTTRVEAPWEGPDRWRQFTYDGPSRALSARVDPRRVLLLDVDATNNSRTLQPAGPAAARKWSLKWMVWLQDLLLTYAFFV